MNIKILAKENLLKTVAEDVFCRCPAGTVGISMKSIDARRALQKELSEKGLFNVYGDGEFPEHVRIIVSDSVFERGEEFCGKTLFLLPTTLNAYLFCQGGIEVACAYFEKNEVEERNFKLAVTGVKTLLLLYLSAVDTAMTSISDVSGEDFGAFRFLEDALDFLKEPPQKQNYIARLVALLKEGEKHLKPPLDRFCALTVGEDENGFQELLFLTTFFKKAVELPFLKLLTLGSRSAETLYFIEECKTEVLDRVFGENALFLVARHIRLLTGKYSLGDTGLEAFFATLNAGVRVTDGGFLSELKKEGVLQAFVKYPL